MEVFNHHIYEYKKGLRRMVLYTARKEDIFAIERKLNNYKISYFMTYPGSEKVNVFFGDDKCVEVIKSFNPKNLTRLTLEEDFILGAVLGYDIKIQCERYLHRKEEEENKASALIDNSIICN
eukprot:Anaeramoba_ignava/a614910_14.p2 GENE.a614910_14~~a614910_14.p2  ORF type:complete len:122 (+),score=2.76 a614910_14:571-936(+)